MAISFYLAFVAATYLAVATWFYGKRKPGYKHVRHTISELAERGSPLTLAVSYGVFLPVGLSLLVAFGLVIGTNPASAMLALSISIGYLVAAVFPCDPGSPVVGSPAQGLHNVGGAVQYLGGAASLMWISEAEGGVYQIAGVVVILALLILSFENPARGVAQRIAETVLFAGLCVALRGLPFS